MAVSSNYSLDYTRDQLIKTAFQVSALLAPGQDPDSDDIEMASSFFNLELMTLQAEGVVLRSVERTTLTLVAGTVEYTLPADTIDVEVGPGGEIGTIVPTSGAETSVVAMTRSEYLGISNKDTTIQSRPTRAYVEKQASVKVVLWPAPDSTSASLRYARTRLLRDMDSGSVTTDLARRWLQAIVYAVASQICLARAMPMDRVVHLRREAERLKAICRADDNQRVSIRARIRHNVRNWN